MLNSNVDKDHLQQMISKMENQVVHGGEAIQDNQEKEEARKLRHMQLKLKKKIKAQKKLAKEKELEKEEQIINAYKDGQKEAEQLHDLVNTLRVKYKGALEEIQDLEKEHEMQREDMLDTIRQQEKELKLYNKINDIMLTPQEFYKIKSKSKYNDNKAEWRVPMFIVKDKKVALP